MISFKAPMGPKITLSASRYLIAFPSPAPPLPRPWPLSVYFCPFWYWCYHLHTLRESVSPRVAKVHSSREDLIIFFPFFKYPPHGLFYYCSALVLTLLPNWGCFLFPSCIYCPIFLCSRAVVSLVSWCIVLDSIRGGYPIHLQKQWKVFVRGRVWNQNGCLCFWT